MTHEFYLAQINVAKARAPLSDPIMARFVARLDEINALADHAPGFVWRLEEHKLPAPDPVAQTFAAEGVIVNLSVWESVEALRHYVYHTAHQELLKARREWFERFDGPWAALWWVPAGHLPSVAEAKMRLDSVQTNGPTEFAFNFQRPFPQPGE